MANPYTATTSELLVPLPQISWPRKAARLLMLWTSFYLLVYAISLPYSPLLASDFALIAFSPFIPLLLLASTIVGESAWGWVAAFTVIPLAILVMGKILGIHKKRTLVATILLAITYGLLLRVFYLLVKII